MKPTIFALPALFLLANCMSTEGANAPREGQSSEGNLAATTPVAPATNGPRRADVYMESLTAPNDPLTSTDETNLTGATTISRSNISGTVSIPTTNTAGTVTAGDRVFDPNSL